MSLGTTLSADRIGGLIWVTFGGAIVYGSWTMDRLEHLHIPLATAPGVVPGLLGLGLMIFGLILVLRRGSAAAAAAGPSFDGPGDVETGSTDANVEAVVEDDSTHWRKVLVSFALCLAYAGLLLGRGIPYWVLTVLFLFAHFMLINDDVTVPARPTLRRTLIAAGLSLAVATAVALVFRYVFLVRLP